MIRYTPLLLSVACAELSMEDDAGTTNYSPEADTAVEEANDELAAAGSLRIDVYAESATDPGLLNQTFLVDSSDTADLDLFLEQPIAISGSLSGFQTYPTADVQVPGALSAIPGVLRAFVPNSLMSYSVDLTEEGGFSFDAVPSENYTLAWIPQSGVNLPFEVEEAVPLLENTDLEKVLSYDESFSLYGSVERSNGMGIPGVSLQVRDVFTGIGNENVLTNNMGGYQFRLYPGDYTIQVSGQSDAGLPTYTSSLTLTDNKKGDCELDFNLGDLQTVNADGLVLDPSGSPQGGVLVRLTALSLDSHKGASFSTESTTGSNGRFSIPVLPGSYQIEYLPPHDGSLSPRLLDEPVDLNRDVVELDSVTLSMRPVVSSLLVGIDGEGMPNSLVRAKERGFDGAVFEAYTNELGVFELEVSEGELDWTLIPSDTNRGATTFLQGSAESLNETEIALVRGQLVSGCVAHTNGTVNYVPVELRQGNNEIYASTFTDGKGCFEVRVGSRQ